MKLSRLQLTCLGVLVLGLLVAIGTPILVMTVLFPPLAIPPNTVEVATPNSIFAQYLVIEAETAPRLTETYALKVPATAGAVILLQPLKGKDEFATVHANDKVLRNWSYSSLTYFRETQLNFIGNDGVAINADGGLALMALRRSEPFNFGIIGWTDFELYSLDEAKTLECDCNNTVSNLSVYIHPSKQLMLELDSSLAYILPDGEVYVLTPDADAISEPRGAVNRATFDEAGEFIAFAYRENYIQVYPFYTELPETIVRRQFGVADEAKPEVVKELRFDAARKWLTGIWGNNVRVWRLEDTNLAPYLEISLASAESVNFDVKSELLFIRTHSSIVVWDLRWKKLITELATPDITSLAVSRDGRSILWGDVTGTVHVMTVK